MADRAEFVDPFADGASAKPAFVDPYQTPNKTEQPRTWLDVPGEAAKNLLPSAYQDIVKPMADLYSNNQTLGFFNPFKLAYHVGSALYDDPALIKKIPTAILNNLVESYGSEEVLKKKIATDPTGFALDLSMLVGGSNAALNRVRRGISDVGKAADVSKPFFDVPPPPPPPPAPPLTPLQRLGEAGMEVNLPRAITSESPVVKAGSVALSKVPWVGAPLDEAVRAVPTQIGRHIENIAEGSGPKLPQNIVGGGIEDTLGNVASKEATAAKAAADATDTAALQKFQTEQAAREKAIVDRQAAATDAADRAFGNVHPMEAAQDTINDVQSAHRQARVRKDQLYDDVNNLDARVSTAAFSDLRPRAEKALVDAGINIDDPGSNASRMLGELDRLSGRPGDLPPNVPPRLMKALQREYGPNVPASVLEQAGFPGGTDAVPPDFRMLGRHAPSPGSNAIPVQGLEHLNKRIGRMGMDAATAEDRNASRIVKGAFDDWRNDALGNHLTPDSAPNAGPVIDAARAAHRDLMDRFGYNHARLPEGEPRNAAKMLNQVVTGGVGPEGLRDNLIGAKPGNRQISAPLYEAISNAVPNAADFRNRMRGAYWNRVGGGSPKSIASDVAGLTPTRMGSHLFDPNEHNLMRGFADLSARTPADLAEVRAATPPKPTVVEPGANQQLAQRILGRNRSEEGIVSKIDSAMQKGGDIKEAARAWGRMTETNRNEFRGNWLRNLGGGENFSIGQFVKNWNGYSDQAKAIMLNREQRQHLNDFHQIATDYQTNLAKYGNPSGTAQVTAWHKLLAGAVKTVGAVVAGTTTLAHPLGVALAGLGARKLSKIMAAPQGARDLSRWSRIAQSYRDVPTAAKLATLSAITHSLNAAGE